MINRQTNMVKAYIVHTMFNKYVETTLRNTTPQEPDEWEIQMYNKGPLLRILTNTEDQWDNEDRREKWVTILNNCSAVNGIPLHGQWNTDVTVNTIHPIHTIHFQI